jgi:hypothetical protein
MAIVNLNMGNLNLEVSSLKNRLAKKEKEKGSIASKIEQGGLLEGVQQEHKNLEEEQDRK